MECIVSGFLFGCVYALFSGQPLTLLGATGPMLIFDLIIYDFCKCHFTRDSRSTTVDHWLYVSYSTLVRIHTAKWDVIWIKLGLIVWNSINSQMCVEFNMRNKSVNKIY